MYPAGAPKSKREKPLKGTLARPSATENILAIAKVIHRHIVAQDRNLAFGTCFVCFLIAYATIRSGPTQEIVAELPRHVPVNREAAALLHSDSTSADYVSQAHASLRDEIHPFLASAAAGDNYVPTGSDTVTSVESDHSSYAHGSTATYQTGVRMQKLGSVVVGAESSINREPLLSAADRRAHDREFKWHDNSTLLQREHQLSGTARGSIASDSTRLTDEHHEERLDFTLLFDIDRYVLPQFRVIAPVLSQTHSFAVFRQIPKSNRVPKPTTQVIYSFMKTIFDSAKLNPGTFFALLSFDACR